jgi:hypothetical protein
MIDLQTGANEDEAVGGISVGETGMGETWADERGAGTWTEDAWAGNTWAGQTGSGGAGWAKFIRVAALFLMLGAAGYYYSTGKTFRHAWL